MLCTCIWDKICLRGTLDLTSKLSNLKASIAGTNSSYKFTDSMKDFNHLDVNRFIHLVSPGQLIPPAHGLEGRNSTSSSPALSVGQRFKLDTNVYHGDPREIYARPRQIQEDNTPPPPPAAHSHHPRASNTTSLDHQLKASNTISLEQPAAAAEVKNMMEARQYVSGASVQVDAMQAFMAGMGQPPPLVNTSKRPDDNSTNHYSILHGIGINNKPSPTIRGGGSISKGTPVYETSMPHLTLSQPLRPRTQEAMGQRLSPDPAAVALYQHQQDQNTKMILARDFQTASQMHVGLPPQVRQLSPRAPPHLSPVDGAIAVQTAISPHQPLNSTRPVGVVWPSHVSPAQSPAQQHLMASPTSRPPFNMGIMQHQQLSLAQNKGTHRGYNSLETLALVAADTPGTTVPIISADETKIVNKRFPETTLTAASLIDAIITSQISRGDTEGKKPLNILNHLDSTVSIENGIRALTSAQHRILQQPGAFVSDQKHFNAAEAMNHMKPPVNEIGELKASNLIVITYLSIATFDHL